MRNIEILQAAFNLTIVQMHPEDNTEGLSIFNNNFCILLHI